MKVTLDKQEISQAIVNYLSVKIGRNITADVEIQAKGTYVNETLTSQDLCAVITVKEQQQ